jgi:CheY-like chemotaxis protein/tetratricopeptide (TPR) repeat protein
VGRTVLYIDDAQQLPARTRAVLESVDFDLVHTGDPEQALRWVHDEPPALVLIEVLLDACDGFELIEQIASTPAGGEVPVVIVTRGERSPELYGRALELGVREFLCKPVLEAQVLEAVLAFGNDEASDARALGAAASAAQEESGDLVDQPLPEILARLHRRGASGVLSLTRGSETRGVQLRNGSPIAVTRPQRRESFEDYVLRTGWIKREQYEDAIHQATVGIRDTRAALEGMGALTAEQAEQAIHEQARDVLLDLFRWASGAYEFSPAARLPEARTLDLVCDPIATLLEGVLHGSPVEVIRAGLAKRGAAYVSATAGMEPYLERVDASPEQRARVAALAGDLTLEEELAAGEIDERLLYGLVVGSVLQLAAEPVLMLVDVLDAETDSVAFNESGEVGVPVSGAEAVEDWLRALADRISAQDDFELFGIEAGVSDGEVQAVYRKLVESFPSIPPELDDLASKVRSRIDQVYGRVGNQDSRAAFAALRNTNENRRAPDPEGARVVDAESWFRKGQACLNADDVHGAIEALGMAMHLDPDQGDYAAHLGYALYQSDPESAVIRREALEHIAKGVKLAPDRVTPLLFLGRVFRLTGNAAMAEKVLRRGLELSADHHGLLQELCLLDVDVPTPKKRDWLRRLGWKS